MMSGFVAAARAARFAAVQKTYRARTSATAALLPLRRGSAVAPRAIETAAEARPVGGALPALKSPASVQALLGALRRDGAAVLDVSTPCTRWPLALQIRVRAVPFSTMPSPS